MKIAIQFKNLRKKLGLSQSEAAKKIGVHVRTISAWENQREGYTNEGKIKNAIDLLKLRAQ